MGQPFRKRVQPAGGHGQPKKPVAARRDNADYDIPCWARVASCDNVSP